MLEEEILNLFNLPIFHYQLNQGAEGDKFTMQHG
jgi:hypothetical protein